MKYVIAVIVIVAGIGGLWYLNKDTKSDKTDTITGTPITQIQEKTATFSLTEVAKSGKTGTLLLASENGKTRATLTVSGESATADRPAHIHVGSCPTPGAVKYALANVIGGSSVTLLDVKLDDILTDGPLSVNVHESGAKIQNYIVCGNITAPATTQTTTTTTSNTQTTTGGATTNTTVTVTTSPVKTLTVNYTDAGFSPASVSINKGDTVKFMNNSNGGMYVASGPHPIHTNYSAFDAKRSYAKGESYSFTFDNVGSWGYHNHVSPSQSGTVIVK